MKKGLIISLYTAIIVTAVSIFSGIAQEKEEYDEDLYGPEELIIWEKPVPGVVFSHKRHTMENGLDCFDCHDDLFEMEAGAAAEQENFTMAAIYEGEYCGACHDGDMATAADKRCTLCHIGVRGVNRLNENRKTAEDAH